MRRYVVDQLELPQTGDEATSLGDDLDGDGTVDNQLGVIFSALVTTHDASTHGADMIASGAIASSVEIQLGDGDTAGVTYYGADGDPATVMGGRVIAGAFSFESHAHSRTRLVPRPSRCRSSRTPIRSRCP